MEMIAWGTSRGRVASEYDMDVNLLGCGVTMASDFWSYTPTEGIKAVPMSAGVREQAQADCPIPPGKITRWQRKMRRIIGELLKHTFL